MESEGAVPEAAIDDGKRYAAFKADLGRSSRSELFAATVQGTLQAVASLAADGVNNISIYEASVKDGVFTIVLWGVRA